MNGSLPTGEAQPEMVLTFRQFERAANAITNARLCIIAQMLCLIPGSMLLITGIAYPAVQVVLFALGRHPDTVSVGSISAYSILSGGALMGLAHLMGRWSARIIERLDPTDESK